jgi:hypothetical protein
MELSKEFQAKLHSALRNARSSSRDLSAFALDVEYYLGQTGLFSRIELKKTGEPQRALLVRCQLRDSYTLMAAVVEQLQRVWVEAPLGYDGKYDIYQLWHDTGVVQMNFVTVRSPDVVITGEIVVDGFRLQT